MTVAVCPCEQLGHGDTVAQATPKVIESLKRKVAGIAAGAFHSVFLLAAGRCGVHIPVLQLHCHCADGVSPLQRVHMR